MTHFKTMTKDEVLSALNMLRTSTDPETIKLYSDILLADLKEDSYLHAYLINVSEHPIPWIAVPTFYQMVNII